MQNQYLLVVDGKPKGPFTPAELKENNIKPDSFVKCVGMDDYKEAQEIDELVKFLGFKSPNRTIQYYASLDQRLLACAIDYFIVSLLLSIIALLIIVSLNNHHQQLTVVLFAAFAFFPLKFLYSIICEASPMQASLGKKLVNIRVADATGKRLSLSQSIVRNLLKLLSFFSLGIGYIICLFNKQNQCLHDYLAKSIVIKDRLL